MSKSRRINTIADRLSEEFVTETGDAAAPDHVGEVVTSAAERLSDAPVQDFVAVFVERALKARLRSHI